MYSIEVNNLSKTYSSTFGKNRVDALKNISLKVATGTIFGLLGPNGAGKTTFVKILLGVTFPTSGTATILGRPIKDYSVKSRIGYLPENHKFPLYLSGEQVLKYFAELSGFKKNNINSRINYLLDLVKMKKWKKTKVKKYSKGMMQRLGIAQAIINDPELIFLDEPTDGVDPLGRKEIRDILLQLKSKGKTIFLNSHLLSEIEMITDNVAILNKGSLVREGTVEEFTTDKKTYIIQLSKEIPEQFVHDKFKDQIVYDIHWDQFKIKVENEDNLNEIIDILRNNDFSIKSVTPVKTTLEDQFIKLINDSENQVKK